MITTGNPDKLNVDRIIFDIAKKENTSVEEVKARLDLIGREHCLTGSEWITKVAEYILLHAGEEEKSPLA